MEIIFDGEHFFYYNIFENKWQQLLLLFVVL